MPSLPQQAALGLDVKNEPAVGFRVALIAVPTNGQEERLADSVMAVNVAGAYVRKAAYHLVESDSSALNVGGKKES